MAKRPLACKVSANPLVGSRPDCWGGGAHDGWEAGLRAAACVSYSVGLQPGLLCQLGMPLA